MKAKQRFGLLSLRVTVDSLISSKDLERVFFNISELVRREDKSLLPNDVLEISVHYPLIKDRNV